MTRPAEKSGSSRLAAGREGSGHRRWLDGEEKKRWSAREWGIECERVQESETVGEFFFFETVLFSWLRWALICIWAMD